ELLINLTNVTRRKLEYVEAHLQVLWDTAQQVNARQKVDASISQGFEKYWTNLGHSSIFKGHILIDCIHRLHDDVVKVWNFDDPANILPNTDFFVNMINLVKPLIEANADPTLSSLSCVQNFGSSGATLLIRLQRDIHLEDSHIKYLYNNYQPYRSTAKLLSTYIINLILVIFGLFSDILPFEPPRALSEKAVSSALTRHREDLKINSLNDIDSYREFDNHPEKVIAKVIKGRLPKKSEL
ncbi:hypothetical protein BYT27DRAFT_7116859, partial [Phlegmacium glaucopus]